MIKITTHNHYRESTNKFDYVVKFKDESSGFMVSHRLSSTRLTRSQIRKHKKDAVKFFMAQRSAGK